MATIYTFTSGQYSSAAQTACDVLDASGYFDTVSLSSNTVTCTKNSETIMTFAYSSGRLDVSVRSIFTQVELAVSAFYISVCTGGILISSLNQKLYAFAISLSKNGKVMLTYRNGLNASNNTVSYAEDTTSTLSMLTQSGGVSSPYFAALYSACAPLGSVDEVSVSSTVSLFVVEPVGISKTTLSNISIGGTRYLTDGNICVKDD